MEVKEAIGKAKSYFKETFAGEDYADFGLEEVVYDYDCDEWRITFGFSRPWDRPQKIPKEFRGFFARSQPEPEPLARRSYKLVTISDDGSRISVRNRELA